MILQEVVLGIIARNQEALLVKRTKQEVGKGGKPLAWGFPGGKIEPGESKEAAVIREVYEETGYQVAVERLLSERIHPDHPVHVSYFLCSLLSDEAGIVVDQGTSETRWVTTSAVQSYMTSPLETVVENTLKNV